MRAMTLALSALLSLSPLPLRADPPPAAVPGPVHPDLGPALTGSEFEAYATGRTLTYSDGGAVWGQEQYLPGRRVIWAFKDAECQFGSWSEVDLPDAGPMLCFTYEDHPEDVNCWQFFHRARGLVAQFMGGGTPLSELGQSDQPMNCPGPQVGA